ncbi:hypothetical protein FB45DRAFT_1150437 [Roridomyces roridus]|uniref:Origin recognition complex subunit 3 N-terminal domain-containing protein n=1 Tax=Roridomyces roridus TaxID=1738132 RepID=A0AAD7BT97_9AGAR|nr:hypothetical protein FB45DRAFT_1150437 [Roridomyces roridus]
MATKRPANPLLAEAAKQAKTSTKRKYEEKTSLGLQISRTAGPSNPPAKKLKADTTRYGSVDPVVDLQVREMEGEATRLRASAAPAAPFRQSPEKKKQKQRETIVDTQEPLRDGTPQATRNKLLRGDAMAAIARDSQATTPEKPDPKTNRRRSSRGHRVSSSFEGGAFTLPHRRVNEESFYKHVDRDVPPSEQPHLTILTPEDAEHRIDLVERDDDDMDGVKGKNTQNEKNMGNGQGPGQRWKEYTDTQKKRNETLRAARSDTTKLPDERYLDERFRRGLQLVQAPPDPAIAKLDMDLQDLQPTLDALHTDLHSARTAVRVASRVLDSRFRLFGAALDTQQGTSTNPEGLLRALTSVDASRPQERISDEARQAAREGHHPEAGCMIIFDLYLAYLRIYFFDVVKSVVVNRSNNELMAMMDDVQQTTIYIPYDDSEDSSQSTDLLDTDLEDGPQLRFDAYMAAWAKCLDRVKAIIEALYNPVVSSILDRLDNIHDAVPGLPFSELPVVAVADFSGGSIFLDRLCATLEATPTKIISHLYPSDCTNLTSAMKTLIGGFVDRDNASRRRAATWLAPHDLGVLQAWYNAQRRPPQLLILLHDFEKFEKTILEDVFYFAGSTSPTYIPLFTIHSITLLLPTRLFVSFHTCPSSCVQLHSSYGSLPLLPGVSLLSFISDYCATHSASLQAIISILHLTHLKHYTAAEPLSFLAHATPTISAHPTARQFAFLDTLLPRLRPSGLRDNKGTQWRAHASAPERLLQAVDAARSAFARQAQRMKLGIALLMRVVGFLRTHLPAISDAQHKRLSRWTGLAFICRILNNRDRAVNNLDGLANLLRTTPELDTLLADLDTYLDGFEETVARQRISALRSRIDDSKDEIADWLEAYLGELLLQSMEEATPLWSVWYTGQTPFPSELLNPALRPSIISGLAFPDSYVEGGLEDEVKEDEERDLTACSGREHSVRRHFCSVLEQQRQLPQPSPTKKGKAGSPRKGKNKAVAAGIH